MSDNIYLSPRMEMIVSMISKGNRLADIGCDHAYVSIAAVLRGISPSALAMDVVKGPLQKASEHVRQYNLSKNIATRLSNGLQNFEVGEADTAIMAGMGGMLIKEIISSNLDKAKSLKELILSPQSNVPELRVFLSENNFQIIDERMVIDEDKYYIVMKVVEGKQVLSKQDELFGPILKSDKSKVTLEYFNKELEKNKEILCKLTEQPSDSAKMRAEEIRNIVEMLGGLLGTGLVAH